MAKHARLSASSAERWMTCPGSVPLTDGIKDEGSEYADEGTAAHFLAAECLTANADAKEFIGKTIVLGLNVISGEHFEFFDGDYDSGISVGTVKVRSKFEVDHEMAHNVQKYLDDVRRVAKSINGTIYVEQRLPIDHLTGEKGAEGTSDVVIVGEKGTLVVCDLKYGQGEAVDATDNKQLLTYMSAANRQFGLLETFDDFHAVIHQPRLNSVSEFMFRSDKLAQFEAEAMAAANIVAEATKAVENGASLEAYLNPSAKGCRWCKRKAQCSALAEFVEQTVGAEMADLTLLPTEAIVETVRPPEPPTDEALAELSIKAAAIPQIEAWIKAVRASVEGLLFAGTKVPGWKLVQGKKGNREWANEDEAIAALKKLKLKDDQLFTKKLITPAKVEPLLASDPKKWEKLVPLITQKEGGPSVAPESDKRPPLEIKPVEEDMTDLTGGEDLLG